MHLQIQLGNAVEIDSLGKLAIIGVSEKLNEKGETVVSFLLVYSVHAPLAEYLDEGYIEINDSSLLSSIFHREKPETLEDVGDSNQRRVIFTRCVNGKLRDSNGFLYATAKKLGRELATLEEDELNFPSWEDMSQVLLETDVPTKRRKVVVVLA